VPKAYGFKEYDKYFCLKPNPGLWLVVLFLLMPFVVMLLTFFSGRRGGNATFMKGIENFLYPDNFTLALAFLASAPALVFIYAWMQRKPGASEHVKKICQNGGMLLTIAAVINIIVTFVPFFVGEAQAIQWTDWVQAGISLFIIGYLRLSQRVKDTFSDFPLEKNASY
jgi:hypothetical protein